ncbi:MAG: hypothetical protein JEZ06_21895 [Anaerolineaceae bacterium]|nr:hypothetical protein [Anaerolineaceae bacterium]
MQNSPIITKSLLSTVLENYHLPFSGIHGITHWARVLENGRRLAAITGANLAVVELFAIFHDSKRQNESRDKGHGKRGAELASQLRPAYLVLSDQEFRLLYLACSDHTDGHTEADITIQTCWDSDRLDLGRVGIRPRKFKLCTAAAKDSNILLWANRRSQSRHVPDLINHEWGLSLSIQ